MTPPDHATPPTPAPNGVTLLAREREIRPRGLMDCCIDMLRKSRRATNVGSEAECSVCHAVVKVDEAGAWSWQPVATAEALRPWSAYG